MQLSCIRVSHACAVLCMCRTDLGTGDEVGLDILINALQGCSEEYVGIKQLIIGGVNEDWPVADELSPEVSSPLCSMIHAL
jgi:Protein of unknown function (DUF3531)